MLRSSTHSNILPAAVASSVQPYLVKQGWSSCNSDDLGVYATIRALEEHPSPLDVYGLGDVLRQKRLVRVVVGGPPFLVVLLIETILIFLSIKSIGNISRSQPNQAAVP